MARGRPAARGMVLASSLVLLVLIALLAISMFSSFGLQERVAQAQRERPRALEAALSAEQRAEWWLANGGAAEDPAVCGAQTPGADANAPRVCSNALSSLVPDVASAPWAGLGPAGGPVGVDYAPSGALAGADADAAPSRYYIALVGPAADGLGSVYRIDAFGYGASRESVVVIESTYTVAPAVRDLGMP
jgi:Tfp pilus assembly protein PilX